MASKTKGVRVYWVNSVGGTVGSDVAVRFTKTRAEFADGGWNYLSETYLTAAQARRAARLPEPKSKVRRAAERTLTMMSKAVELIEEALDAEPEQPER